jgi:hypothetical protein
MQLQKTQKPLKLQKVQLYLLYFTPPQHYFLPFFLALHVLHVLRPFRLL